jgi:thiol-disulfide isomerase/thioredoxin
MSPARALAGGLLASVLVLALGCAGRQEPAPRAVAPAPLAQDRPFVVVLHAEWCAACKRVAPVVAWLRTEYVDRVMVVELDITDQDAQQRSALVAEPLGLGPFFAQNKDTPGITILGRDRQTVHHFTVEGRPGPYRSALEEAFASFSAR